MKTKPIHQKPYDHETLIVGYSFYCEGCGHPHEVPTVPNSGLTGGSFVWNYNANPVNPTFQPSVNIATGLYAGSKLVDEVTATDKEWNETLTRLSVRCHSIVTDGKIYYCNDTTHQYSGKTIDLLDIERWPERYQK